MSFDTQHLKEASHKVGTHLTDTGALLIVHRLEQASNSKARCSKLNRSGITFAPKKN